MAAEQLGGSFQGTADHCRQAIEEMQLSNFKDRRGDFAKRSAFNEFGDTL
jgi:hypothetical protein